ncbi:MAG: DUF3047 domain-containing protein [Geobacter sp.]|nr:DUF3047 domain-containing protein [Geobacter sp.]
MKFQLILLLLLGAVALPAVADKGSDIKLPLVPLSAWTEKSFKGETRYSVEQHDGRNVVRAESSASASGYYHKLDLAAKDFPCISWSWKIARTIAAENPFQKSGDDYAARVYIVFPGRFFWQKRAIAYVWSDKLPVGKVVPNPYTDRVAIIAVESGNSFAGSWRNESRNYVDDYRAYFHHEPDKPEAVAFMTDTDNTGSHAVAWYGDISFNR